MLRALSPPVCAMSSAEDIWRFVKETADATAEVANYKMMERILKEVKEIAEQTAELVAMWVCGSDTYRNGLDDSRNTLFLLLRVLCNDVAQDRMVGVRAPPLVDSRYRVGDAPVSDARRILAGAS